MKKTIKRTTNRLTKSEKIKRLRVRLIKACDAHLKSGKKIIDGNFQDTSIDGCCPVACLTGTPGSKQDYSDVLAQKLKFGFSATDMWAFIDGFDGSTKSIYSGTPEFKLGLSLRKKYIKEKK